MRKSGLLIKENEVLKIVVTNYETQKEEEIEIKNGEIINNSNNFKLLGHKIYQNGYFLESIIDNSGKFLGKTKIVSITSKCKVE